MADQFHGNGRPVHDPDTLNSQIAQHRRSQELAATSCSDTPNDISAFITVLDALLGSFGASCHVIGGLASFEATTYVLRIALPWCRLDRAFLFCVKSTYSSCTVRPALQM